MFRSLAVSSLFFSSLLVGGGAASIESPSSSFSSPRDALAVFEKVIHSASSLMTADPHHGLEERNLAMEDISLTCLNETQAALETVSLVDMSQFSTEDPSVLESACTVNTDMTNIKCDVSKLPGINDAIETSCTEGGHAFVEVSYVMSLDSMRAEYNNMGFCVGSSCSTDELDVFFDGLSDGFGELLSAFGDDTTSGMTISFELETSSSPNRMLSSFAAGAIAASVGLVSLFLA